jgi:hypothetical protein
MQYAVAGPHADVVLLDLTRSDGLQREGDEVSTKVDATLSLSIGGHPVEQDAGEQNPLLVTVQDVDAGDSPAA